MHSREPYLTVCIRIPSTIYKKLEKVSEMAETSIEDLLTEAVIIYVETFFDYMMSLSRKYYLGVKK